MTASYSNDELVRSLVGLCDISDRAHVAKTLNISVQLLSQIILGQRQISSALARRMGYEKVTRYEKIIPIDKCTASS